MVIKLVKNFKTILFKDVIRRDKVTPFIVFVSFLVSFSLARIISWSFPTANIIIKQYHIHHFYYGLALLTISNWAALVSNSRWVIHRAAILFGVGLGLIVDELGLLLTCGTAVLECDYWAGVTYDIFVFLGGLLLAILYSGPAIRLVKSRVLTFNQFITQIILRKNGKS